MSYSLDIGNKTTDFAYSAKLSLPYAAPTSGVFAIGKLSCPD